MVFLWPLSMMLWMSPRLTRRFSSGVSRLGSICAVGPAEPDSPVPTGSMRRGPSAAPTWGLRRPPAVRTPCRWGRSRPGVILVRRCKRGADMRRGYSVAPRCWPPSPAAAVRHPAVAPERASARGWSGYRALTLVVGVAGRRRPAGSRTRQSGCGGRRALSAALLRSEGGPSEDPSNRHALYLHRCCGIAECWLNG